MKRILAIALCLVMALTLFAGCSGESAAKGVVEDFAKAMKKLDAEAIVKLIPEEALEESGMDADEATEMLEASFEEMEEADFKLSYKLGDAEKLEDDDLEDIQDMYDEIDLEVKEAWEVELEMTVEIDGEEEEDEMTLIAIKIGSKWYLDIASMSMGIM